MQRPVRVDVEVAERDERALEELYKVTSDRLYSMALHWLRDEGAAREAVQDCYLRIWKRAGRYDPARSQPFTWCVMILRGLCLDQLRKLRRVPRLAEDLEEGETFLLRGATIPRPRRSGSTLKANFDPLRTPEESAWHARRSRSISN